MIDWSRVDELRNDLGAEDFEEITALFLEEVEERLDSLSAGTSTNLSDDFHFLKGSAANLGFETLREVCQKGETCGDAADIPGLLDVYKQSKQAFMERV